MNKRTLNIMSGMRRIKVVMDRTPSWHHRAYERNFNSAGADLISILLLEHGIAPSNCAAHVATESVGPGAFPRLPKLPYEFGTQQFTPWQNQVLR